MLHLTTNTSQTKLLAVFLGLRIAQVGALSAARARALRSAAYGGNLGELALPRGHGAQPGSVRWCGTASELSYVAHSLP